MSRNMFYQPSGVAHIYNPLYCRFAIGSLPNGTRAVESRTRRGLRTPCRLKTCDTADYKSALRGLASLRGAARLINPARAAQMLNLLYRRFVIGRLPNGTGAVELRPCRGRRTPCRLKTCDTADYKSALRGPRL